MERPYDIFGAKLREPPQLTAARAVIGVGRNASPEEIRKAYYAKAGRHHPDLHPCASKRQAEERFSALASAYRLLTNPSEREEAGADFQRALEHPFQVGERIFCLGSLYGVRIVIPSTTLTDPRRLLEGKAHPGQQQDAPPVAARPSRGSILESRLADELEMFYGGTPTPEAERLLVQGFLKRDAAGLDDLEWIRGNDIAVTHFLNRRFKEASLCFQSINRRIRSNTIFMYRYGLSLEAYVAQPGYRQGKPDRWRFYMAKAVNLYKLALKSLHQRHYSFPEGSYTERFNPESVLTLSMQLADAHDAMGESAKSQRIWDKIRAQFPDCYEAEVRSRDRARSRSAIEGMTGWIRGLLR